MTRLTWPVLLHRNLPSCSNVAVVQRFLLLRILSRSNELPGCQIGAATSKADGAIPETKTSVARHQPICQDAPSACLLQTFALGLVVPRPLKYLIIARAYILNPAIIETDSCSPFFDHRHYLIDSSIQLGSVNGTSNHPRTRLARQVTKPSVAKKGQRHDQVCAQNDQHQLFST